MSKVVKPSRRQQLAAKLGRCKPAVATEPLWAGPASAPGAYLSPEAAEEFLDREVAEIIGDRMAKWVPRDLRSFREGIRIQTLYPGHHVAYRDHHDWSGEDRRIARREVLFATPDFDLAGDLYEQVPDDIRDEVWMTFVDPPHSRLRVF